MSANILNIISLLQGEKVGTPNSWTNMASTSQSGCHNYKLTGVSICNTDIPTTTLFIEIPAFDSLIYKENKKGFESGKGQEVISWRSLEPVLPFQIMADETIQNLFQRLKLHETVTFTRLHGSGSPESFDVADLEIQGSSEDVVTRLDVKIYFKDSLSIKKLCCGNYYTDAPYNECDGEGETGDPNNDPTCVGLEVSIGLGAGPVLTATPSGGPGVGIETVTWYLDGVLFGTGSSVVPVLAGTYRVDYQIGNCFATDEFTYNTPCTGFETEISQLILGDGSVILIATSNLLTTTWIWEKETSPGVWEVVIGETDVMFQPDTSGNYRATGTSTGGCEDVSNEITVTLGVDCDGLFTLGISITDGVITAEVSAYAGIEVPTYAWYLDEGAGPVLQSGTGSTLNGSTPGLYQVFVTLEGCVQSAHIFVNCEMAVPPCGDPCDLSGYQEFGPGVSGANFSITNFVLLDPAFYTSDQINAVLLIEKNGVRIYHGQTGRTGYSIDYATQQIQLDAAWPLKTTELLTATKLK